MKTIPTLVWLFIIAAIFYLAVQRCHSQTNQVAATPAPYVTSAGFPENPSPAWMDKTASDVSAVLNDFGVPVTPQAIKGLLGLAVAAFFGARLLRKGLPDRWQEGIIGTTLKHVALEINPKADAPEKEAAIAAAAPVVGVQTIQRPPL